MVETYIGERTIISTNNTWKTGHHLQNMKLDPFLSLVKEISSNWIKHLWFTDQRCPPTVSFQILDFCKIDDQGSILINELIHSLFIADGTVQQEAITLFCKDT